jgi:hypothetical protein
MIVKENITIEQWIKSLLRRIKPLKILKDMSSIRNLLNMKQSKTYIKNDKLTNSDETGQGSRKKGNFDKATGENG